MGTIAASDNEFPKVIFVEGAAPGTPPAGFVYVYAKADGRMYGKDDTGTEFAMNGATAEASIAAHLADTSDAHDASAVSVADAGNVFTGTDVEAVLAELYSAVSGGGIPATIIDAKGDLIAGTAADTAARLAVGTNGYYLSANSGQSTGLEWVVNRIRYCVTSQHDITSTTATEVTLTPTPTLEAGTYMFICHLLLRSASTTNGPRIGINFTGTQTLLHAVFHYEDNAVTASVGSMATPGGLPFGHIHGSGSVASASTTTPNMGPDGVQATGTNVMAIIQGIIVVTVAGDFELWHGCESGATQTSVMANSTVQLTRVA